jgi:integrase
LRISKRTWTYHGKSSSAWRLDWRDSSGRHKKQFKTQREADLFMKKLIREGEQTEYGVLPEITFDKFVEVYVEKKPWRSDSYRERISSALGLVPFAGRALRAIGRADIEQYRDTRKQKSAASTVRQDLAAIQDCFKWAVKLKYLRKSPCEDVEKPALPVKQDDPQQFIPRDDFYDKLLPVAGKDEFFWEFMAWTGLRITEALALEWPDVNLKEGYVLVRRGKGRKQRLVPLLEPATKALGKEPRRLGAGQKVFGRASDRHACLRRFQRQCVAAGIGAFRIHDLRHTFGSWAAQAGVDLEVIAACMGHTSTTVTRQYAHLSPAYKRNELGKMLGAREEHARYNRAKRKRAHRS